MANETITYLRSFLQFSSKVQEELFNSNRKRNDIQPEAEPEVVNFISFLILLTKPKNILELGTSNGFSTLSIGKAAKEVGAKVVTIDSKERLHLEAVDNIKKDNLQDVVTLKYGNAEEIVPALNMKFDLIFQDCGKYLYPLLYEDLVEMLNSGGLLIADDTLFKAIPEIRDSLSSYTDEYNRRIFSDERLVSTILPVGHGLTVSFKK